MAPLWSALLCNQQHGFGLFLKGQDTLTGAQRNHIQIRCDHRATARLTITSRTASKKRKKNNHNKPNKPQWTTRISQQTKLKPCPKQLDPQQWSPQVLLGPLLPSHPGVLLSGGSELQPCLHPGHGMPWSHGMVTITFVMAIQWNWEYLNKNAEKCHDCR